MIISISGNKNSGKDLVGKIILYFMSECDQEEGWDFVETDEYYQLGSDWQIKKFADKLKDCVCLILSCTREDLENEEFKNKKLGEEWWYYNYYDINLNKEDYIEYLLEDTGRLPSQEHLDKQVCKLTPRLLLQFLGTECARNIIHPNIWINGLMKDYVGLPHKWSNWTRDSPGESFPNWIITDLRFPNEYQAVKDKGFTIHVNRNTETIDNHSSENTKELINHFDDNVIFVENNGTIEELVKQIQLILLNKKLIQ